MADDLWDAKRCAQFLGVCYDHFRKEVRYREGMPQPLDLPGRDRWSSQDWYDWADRTKRRGITLQARTEQVNA